MGATSGPCGSAPARPSRRRGPEGRRVAPCCRPLRSAWCVAWRPPEGAPHRREGAYTALGAGDTSRREMKRSVLLTMPFVLSGCSLMMKSTIEEELVRRASFELDCPPERLTVTPLTGDYLSKTQGVAGCGKRSVFFYTDRRWFRTDDIQVDGRARSESASPAASSSAAALASGAPAISAAPALP